MPRSWAAPLSEKGARRFSFELPAPMCSPSVLRRPLLLGSIVIAPAFEVGLLRIQWVTPSWEGSVL